MYPDTSEPMIIRPSQKPTAFRNTNPTDPAVTEPSSAMPTITARMIIPSTSSITAPASTVTPSGESSRLISARTLAVMPTEVAVMMDPTNSAGSIAWIDSRLANPSMMVAPKPMANGRTTPPAATAVAGRTYFMNC